MLKRSLIVSSIMLLLSPAICFSKIPDKFSFKEVEIPRDELRQQRLLNLIEYRASFEQPANIQNIFLLAETYKKGKPVGLHEVSLAIGWNEPKPIPTFISVGWQEEKKQLSVFYDNGLRYGPYGKHITLPAKEFDGPVDAYVFEESTPESRPSKFKEFGPVKLYPVMSICGQRNAKLRGFDPKSTAADLIKAYSDSGAETAIIIYLYFSEHSGSPPLEGLIHH